ncbi:MAG: signal recognition particle subunit SRP19/SEC65 family protein [Candidatus Jordarchaeum sp.]|uniref:signal recognition particle subunit SRP19/SEC65 family protein n=1 Tax=Candidatus Jordarchaeum sp. TaxID=2823881 RepID=UPI00404AE0E0
MRKKDRIILYPEYFDSRLTRGKGRRVPLSISVPAPNIEELALISKRLGYEFEVDADSAHPNNWWNKRGRILITRNDLIKNEVIKTIAKILSKARKRKKERDKKR